MTQAILFLIGLGVGSFLNVVIHRSPRGESVIRPRSYCPKCAHPVSWYDNVPLLSFVLLRGRCRHCQGRISWRYPAVELASGLVWLGSWQGSFESPTFWIRVVFVSLLLIVTVTDLETGLIPDRVTFLGMGAGLGASFFYPGLQSSPDGLIALTRSALGLSVGGGLIAVTGLAGNWIFQRELVRLRLDQSMGGGDVKLLAMAGSFLGWEKVLLAFFTAPLLGLPFALYQRFAKKEEIIPYGPFLSLAAAVQFFYGETFWRYFLRI